MKYMGNALFILLGACVCASAFASDGSPPSIDTIREQQGALQAGIEAGKTDGLTPRQVNIVRKSQKQVFELIDGRKDLADLSIEEKIRLNNALETINAQMKGGRLGQDEQQVCWRERKTGSTTKVTRCGSQAERDFLRQNAREYLEKPRVCTPPGCGASPE
jgi:hypothetical protein